MALTVKFMSLLVFGLRGSLAQAQTCDPIKSDVGACKPNPGLDAKNYFIDFTQQSSLPDEWTVANYENVSFGPHGAEFAFNQRYDAPNIWTDFYILFGHVDVVMQAAPGQGIVSSSVLISDDYDEIDWEFSGNNFGDTSSGGQVQTNFYGKGDTGYYDRGANFDVSQPQASFHTYSVDWTKDQLVWLIDGKPERTLLASQCDNDTHQYPQTPMKLQLGLWDGGDPEGNPGTVNWAGGYTNLSQVPFTMYVKSVSITNYSPGYGYNYTDTTGSWESIQILQSPLSSSSSKAPSTVHTRTSSTPPVQLSASSVISSLSSDSATSTIFSQSAESSEGAAAISSSLDTSGDTTTALGTASNSEDCDCEDETSTVYVTQPVASQGSQASVANIRPSQPGLTDSPAGAVPSLSSGSATGLLPYSIPTALVSTQLSPSAPAASSYSTPAGSSYYGSSGPESQTQPSSQPSLLPSYGSLITVPLYGAPGESSSAAYSQSGSGSSAETVSYTTVIVSKFTTVCPSPTQLTINNRTYTVSSSTTLTVTDCPCTLTHQIPTPTSGINGAPTSPSISYGPPSPGSGLPNIASSMGSTSGFGVRPKGNETKFTNTSYTSEASFLSHSKTSSYPSPVSVQSVPTTSVSPSGPVQSTTSKYSPASSLSSPVIPSSYAYPTTSVKPISSTVTSSSKHTSTSPSTSWPMSTYPTHAAPSTQTTMKSSSVVPYSSLIHPSSSTPLIVKSSSPIPYSSLTHPATSSKRPIPYSQTSHASSSVASSSHLSSTLHLSNTTRTTPTSLSSPATNTHKSSLPSSSTSPTHPSSSAHPTTSSFATVPKTSSTPSRSSSANPIYSSSVSHPVSTTSRASPPSTPFKYSSTSPTHSSISHPSSTTSYISTLYTTSRSSVSHKLSSTPPKPPSTTPRSTSTTHKPSSTTPKPSLTSKRPVSSTCTTHLASPTPSDCICGDQGHVVTPALLQTPTSCKDLNTCRNQCLDKSDCASFSYCDSTKECQMYSKILQEQGGVTGNSNNGIFHYHRDCFETACTTYGAAKSTTSVPAWRFGW